MHGDNEACPASRGKGWKEGRKEGRRKEKKEQKRNQQIPLAPQIIVQKEKLPVPPDCQGLRVIWLEPSDQLNLQK